MPIEGRCCKEFKAMIVDGMSLGCGRDLMMGAKSMGRGVLG